MNKLNVTNFLESQELEDKILSDVGAEKAILACLMTEPAKMVEASVRLKSEDFYEASSQYLYMIMSAIYSKKMGKGCVYDITTLRSVAAQQGKEEDFLAKTGKEYLEYLTMVQESMVDLASFQDYVDTVYSLSMKRKLLKTNEEFKKTILESNDTPEDLMTQERTKLDNLFISTATSQNILKNLGGDAKEFIDKSLKEQRTILGIPTGFPRLDRVIEGLKRKNVLIVAAAKKTGKSSLLMNIGLNVAVKQKIPTLMISTEMSDEEILSRGIACLARVNEIDIRKGRLDATKKARVLAAEKEFREGKFYHTEMRSFTVDKVVGLTRKFVNNIVGFKEDGKPNDCLVIFDYIKLPSNTSDAMKDKEYKVLGMMADAFKELAGGLDIPMLTACQTNRSGDIANSYEITWFCNTFMVLGKKSNKEIENDEAAGELRGNQRLKIMDNRGGSTDEVGIEFDYHGPHLCYTELAERPDQKKYGN